MLQGVCYIGCAGHSLPRAQWPHFPARGTHLERYAARFSALEINSSFYRPHRPETYARWAASVPADFRFSVKLPRAITHERALQDSDALLAAFLAQAGALGEKLGALLVQLPPGQPFRPAVAEAFLQALRARFAGAVVCEPRHPSWFTPAAQALLHRHRVARVAADPAPVPAAALPEDWPPPVYFRLHGTPRMYYSAYDEAFLQALAADMAARRSHGETVWCIFDNTARGAATANALWLLARLSAPHGREDGA